MSSQQGEQWFRRQRYCLTPCLILIATICTAKAYGDHWGDEASLPIRGIEADPSIPTLKEVVGHSWAERITTHSEAERYFEKLTSAAPDRSRLIRYGESYEGRGLYYLVIGSVETINRLDQVKTDLQKLADPRLIEEGSLEAMIAETPALVWLAYGVHGDEISSTDAALVTAYTLLADRRTTTEALFEDVLVIIDPMQNPDGRERFLASNRQGEGRFPMSNPFSVEHTQPWPGGRYNHYFFDLNRDWYIQTQQETKVKVAAYLDWQPQIYVDAHEMGANSTYYFDPPSDPKNPQITDRQRDWFDRIGRTQAGLFDRYGFAYTTREIFDAFYPGYGSTWPTMHGAIGILWEQASARGLLVDRDDETVLRYRDGVLHHYVSGLATITAASEGKADLLTKFVQGRMESIERGKSRETVDTFLLIGNTPNRTTRLAFLLLDNGIEVRRLTQPTTVSHGEEARLVPAGSYYVPGAQPAGRLAETLLSVNQEMDPGFLERQRDRFARRLGDEIYDVTAWSLPLTFGIEAIRGRANAPVESAPVDQDESLSGGTVEGPASPQVGYLIPTVDEAGLNALADLLRKGYRVHVTDRSFVIDGRRFSRGTLLLRTAENPDSLPEIVRRVAEEYQLSITAIDSSYVDEGIGLGGPNVAWVAPPSVAMAVGDPTTPFVGHTWYLFDRVWSYPTIRVNADTIVGRFDLDAVNVLILPSGSYSPSNGFDEEAAQTLKRWVREGGTLILVGGALSWGLGESIDLMPTKRREVPVINPIPGEGLKFSKAEDSDEKDASSPETETPRAVPGAFLNVTLYDDHWLTAGLPNSTPILTNTKLILEPLKPTDGRNLVTFQTQNKPVSGFCWESTLKAIGGTPFLLYRSLGDGHVIGFTDDPSFRALSPVTQRLLRNAVFFGPGH